jgi:hypothetical protein
MVCVQNVALQRGMLQLWSFFFVLFSCTVTTIFTGFLFAGTCCRLLQDRRITEYSPMKMVGQVPPKHWYLYRHIKEDCNVHLSHCEDLKSYVEYKLF